MEHYAAPAVGGAAVGGSGSATGGKDSPAGTGGKPSSAGNAGRGNEPAQGGEGGDTESGSGGDGGDGGNVPEPPTDLGCGSPPVSSGPFTRRALRAAAAECAQWHYCRLESGTRTLAEALDDHVATPTEASLAAARAAFATAFSLTSTAELFQFGPYPSGSAGAGKDSYQGQGYRELVYSWPLSSRCKVEEQLVTRAYARSMSSVLVNARGMFALDYLLHYPGSDTECTPTSATGKAWPTLGADGVAAAKLEYAQALGKDLWELSRTLRSAWSPEQGDFTPVLVDSTGYPSEQEAMKVIAWSLLYVERDVKDWKLGLPAGHTASAPVSVAEAAFSGLKTEAIRSNLRGFRGLYQGCGAEGEGLGFDDWLIEAGHPELAGEIVSAYVDAQAVADASPPLDDATPGEVEALYQAVKRLTNLLKSDLFGAGSPIGLTLPPGLEGDTD